MMKRDTEIFLFQNIRQVILAERWCSVHKLTVRVLPVPRPYSTECGMCLEVGKEDGDMLEEFTASEGMVIRRIGV